MRRLLLAALLAGAACLAHATEAPLKVLFLGDKGHHKPAERFAQLQPVLAARGIEMVYTDRVADLDPQVLAAYDAMAVYANIDTLPAKPPSSTSCEAARGSCRSTARATASATHRRGLTSSARSSRSTAPVNSAP